MYSSIPVTQRAMHSTVINARNSKQIERNLTKQRFAINVENNTWMLLDRICLLSWSVGVIALTPCKLLNISEKYPPLLPSRELSALLYIRESKALGWRHRHTDRHRHRVRFTRQHSASHAIDNEWQRHKERQARIQVWPHSWWNYTKGKWFDFKIFLNGILMHWWWLGVCHQCI